MNIKKAKHKHLTLDDRTEIQLSLNRGINIKGIAMIIGRDQTTIAKEIKKHIEIRDEGITRTDSDGNIKETEICPELLKSPYVCNPCTRKRTRCGFQKQYYNAKHAQEEYETVLRESREGIPLSKESFYEMDRILADGIKRGQRLYHIMQTVDLGVSKSTVYRHLNKGYLSIGPLDFPRVVKFKPRKKGPGPSIPKALRLGRTYDDFLAYVEENDLASWVEMDTVIGRIGGKVILTLHFTFCNFMLGVLLDNKSAAETAAKIKSLKASLAAAGFRFGDIFPLILTDNGSEFADVFSIENNLEGNRESLVFFCDPMQPHQKPRVEKNHTLLRDILPKGTSFDSFNQSAVNLIFSHINSIKRKNLNGKTPYELFTFTYGDKLTNILGIEHIPALEVVQSPKLIKVTLYD